MNRKPSNHRVHGVTGLIHARKGAVLLIVLIIVMMIALAAYGFTFFMRIEYRTTNKLAQQTQAESAAKSGTEWLLAYLEAPASQRSMIAMSQTGTSVEEDDSVEAEFAPWRFAIVSPSIPNNELDPVTSSPLRVGWEDESAKINLLALAEWEQQYPGHTEEVLNRFTEMSPEIRIALLRAMGISSSRSPASSDAPFNAIDSDANGSLQAFDPTTLNTDAQLDPEILPTIDDGAEPGSDSGVGITLDQAVAVMPGQPSPSDSTTQLRALIEPVDDWNRNYEHDESDSTDWLRSSPQDPNRVNVDLSLFESSTDELHGDWRSYVTIDSAERNESMSGRPRIDLNEADLSLLQQKMLEVWPAEWANFIVLYRQYGPGSASSSASNTTVQSANQYAVDLNQSGKVPIESVFDLIGVNIVIPQSEETAIKVPSPFPSDVTLLEPSLARLLDEATTIPEQRIVGRVNIVSAPRPVLMAIPGVTESLADRIIETRRQQSDSPDDVASIAWLLSLEDVDLITLKQLEPFMTVRSDVVKAQVIGYRDALDPIYRFVGVFDGTVYPARLTHYQEFHSLGRGFAASRLDALLSSPSE